MTSNYDIIGSDFNNPVEIGEPIQACAIFLFLEHEISMSTTQSPNGKCANKVVVSNSDSKQVHECNTVQEAIFWTSLKHESDKYPLPS